MLNVVVVDAEVVKDVVNDELVENVVVVDLDVAQVVVYVVVMSVTCDVD